MGKTYIITGTTSGIGKALLEKLASYNTVFAGYRNEKYIDDIKSLGGIPFYIDMENSKSISDAAEFIRSNTDKIDTIINVAGCVIAGIMEILPVEKIKKQFEVNTFGHLDFTQKLVNLFNNGTNTLPICQREREQVLASETSNRAAGEGAIVKCNLKIINISSMASFGIFPFVAPYCASKRALDILFNAMTLESGIKVISIKPGVIATPLWDKSIELNSDAIDNCSGYEKEMKYLVGNARRNGHRGLTADKVADFIIKVDGLKNAKPSYTIGWDAKMAELFAKLPFGVQNRIVKTGMDLRVKGHNDKTI